MNIAVRQDLLRQTYKLREVDKIDVEGRHGESMDIDTVEQDYDNNETIPVTIKDIRELPENIAAIASNFRKAQGQYNTAHNIGEQNTKPTHISMTHNSIMQHINKNVNVNQRNRYHVRNHYHSCGTLCETNCVGPNLGRNKDNNFFFVYVIKPRSSICLHIFWHFR